jgi:hypothetical protein
VNKEKCDICGNDFVWKKGMAYCSYDCEQKARQKLKQLSERYQEKIKNETQCPDCGFVGVDINRWFNDDHGLYWETFYTCKNCGRRTKDKQWYVHKNLTNGEKIWQSGYDAVITFAKTWMEKFSCWDEAESWLNAPADAPDTNVGANESVSIKSEIGKVER